jgi:MFS family permease
MFYGWRVVAGAFIGMVLANGIFTYGFTVLVDPIREEFGASLEQVMYSLTIGTFFGLVFGPVVGVLIDRFSVRVLMFTGCLLTALGLYGISSAQSVGQFNILVGVTMSMSMAMVSSMPGSAAVSRWFTVSRGKALGIASMGTSLGGMIVPFLLTWWVEAYGWRGALQNLAITALVFVAPFIWLTVRSRPEDIGMYPEAMEHVDVATDSPESTSMGMGDIIRTKPFWLIALSMGMVFAGFSSMLANLSPYAARLGVGETAISTMIAVLAFGGLVGKFVFGTAADKVNLKYGLWSAHALLGTAFIILIFEPSYPWLLLAAVCFGLSTGGLLPVWNAMVARVFGVDSFGRAMGAMGPVITLSIMPAYAVVGRLFDNTGSYTMGLWVMSACIVLAAVLLLPLKVEDRSGV